MKDSHSSITLVLDRSGSMQSCLEAAISATNQFIREQASAEGSADLSVVLFDDVLEFPYENTPIEKVTEFTTASFQPRGCTALLDAIGHSIDRLGQELARLPEAERPGSVIVAILTDGYENASSDFDWHQIQQKIRHQEDVYYWQFLFLAAGQDAIAQASHLGISQANSSAFANDDTGYESSSAAISKKINAIRYSRVRPLTDAEAAALNTPLHDLVQEEDTQRRQK